MTDFKGKNNIPSTTRLAFERAKYNLKAFPENNGRGPNQVVDFNFAERTFYGRVNRQHDPVIPQLEYIQPISDSNNNEEVILALNFVADQFSSFQTHYIRACRMSLIPIGDPYLSEPKAYRGYEDPMGAYEQYVYGILNLYNNEYLADRKNQIRSFEEYIKFIPHFMERMTATFPITLSGFMRSNQSSIFHTGLAIDIGDISFSEDEIKQNAFLDSPSFQYYITMAKQYGFSINKRNPSVLICDLASPGTAPYRANYDISSVSQVFDDQYDKTIYHDIDLLSTLLLEYYNTFVDLYPLNREIYVCGDTTSQGKITHSNVTQKEYIYNINNINKIYKLYLIIRNIEERKPYTEREIDAHYKIALRYNKLSQQSMINYIEEIFREKYMSKRGTLTYFLEKQQKKLDKEE